MWNEAEEEQTRGKRDSYRMSHFVDHGVLSACGRIRNVPLLELLAVSIGLYLLSSSIPTALWTPGGIWARRTGCQGQEVG